MITNIMTMLNVDYGLLACLKVACLSRYYSSMAFWRSIYSLVLYNCRKSDVSKARKGGKVLKVYIKIYKFLHFALSTIESRSNLTWAQLSLSRGL